MRFRCLLAFRSKRTKKNAPVVSATPRLGIKERSRFVDTPSVQAVALGYLARSFWGTMREEEIKTNE
jgi:hypothetical protein